MLTKIKSIFNNIFSEEIKNKIRNKFDKLFMYMDKQIFYKEYLKAYKYILRKKIFDYEKKDYGYRYDGFLNQVKLEYIKSKIIHDNMWIRDDEMKEAIDYTLNHDADVFCGRLNGIKVYSEKDIIYDEESGLYCGLYEGKRLYFDKSVTSIEIALNNLNGLAAEQSEHSPHKYLTDEFTVDSEDIVFDVGCADGNFALSVADKVKEIYLFEVEEKWMQPLKLTFAPYSEKVHIIKKCVTRNSDMLAVSLDDFCKENHIEQIGIVKMDVEGYEKDVLAGAEKMISENRIKKFAVCTYHKIDDEQTLGAMLPNYNKVMAEGYMLGAMLQDIWNIKPPYFTKGVMRATLK